MIPQENEIKGLKPSLMSRIWHLYYDGFREMTVGKTLWAIILLKLFVFFVVMKLLFFPNILSRDFATDEERASHVRHELTKKTGEKFKQLINKPINLSEKWMI